ncbi:MAG: hypothetical protein HKN13_01895 [Rhodothermales bacterium]|nr:hypothetical protein [Rhodothermales bacterium]
MSSPDWTPAVRQHTEQFLRVVEPVAQAAAGFAGFFGTLAMASTLAAVVLLLLLFVGLEVVTLWKILLMVVVSVLLVLPGAVLGAFWIGLKQLVAIPQELGESLGDFGERSAAAFAASSTASDGHGRIRRLLRFVRSLVDVRSSILQSKDVVVKSLVLVRVANPVSLVAVLIATALACLLVLIASAAGLIVLFA